MPSVLFDAHKGGGGGGGDIIICMDIKGNNHFLMSNTVCLTLYIVIPTKQIPKITKVIIPFTDVVQTM